MNEKQASGDAPRMAGGKVQYDEAGSRRFLIWLAVISILTLGFAIVASGR